jgi:hypothetical protein
MKHKIKCVVAKDDYRVVTELVICSVSHYNLN